MKLIIVIGSIMSLIIHRLVKIFLGLYTINMFIQPSYICIKWTSESSNNDLTEVK